MRILQCLSSFVLKRVFSPNKKRRYAFQKLETDFKYLELDIWPTVNLINLLLRIFINAFSSVYEHVYYDR